MKRRHVSSSSLFLMELILAILIFCIAASICILGFSRSHILHKESVAINESVNVVQNTAEAIRSGVDLDSVKSNLSKLYPGINTSDLFPSGTATILLDENFNSTDSDATGRYILMIDSEKKDTMICSTIILSKTADNEPIFDLYIEHNIQ